MPSPGMRRRVALDVSKERMASVIRVETIRELGALAITSNCSLVKNRRVGGTYRLHHQGEENRRAGNVNSN
jgi:hypothetical protein